jgi:magnesium chelatase family protein
VAAARSAAAHRRRGLPWNVNGAVPGATLRSHPFLLPRRAVRPAETFLERGALSARGFDRVLRIAWTIADLAGRSAPGAEDVSQALYYRTGRAGSWAA